MKRLFILISLLFCAATCPVFATTLGYTVVGSNTDYGYSSYTVYFRIGCVPANVVANYIFIANWSDTGTRHYKVALYADDGAGKAGAYVVNSYSGIMLSSTTAKGKWEESYINANLLKGVTYYVGFTSDNDNVNIAYNYGGTGKMFYVR